MLTINSKMTSPGQPVQGGGMWGNDFSGSNGSPYRAPQKRSCKGDGLGRTVAFRGGSTGCLEIVWGLSVLSER